MSAPKIKLNNGYEIPVVGLGTWQSKPHEVAAAVSYALKHGYRHIDCAWSYFNEKEVAQGIRESGVPRSEIFITSKLWSTSHSRVEEAVDKSLANLETDYLDLYLIHWPVSLKPNGDAVIPLRPDGSRDVDFGWKITDTWKQMEDLVKKGKVRSIGCSNFSQKKVKEILSSATIRPVVDQLELHLYNPQLKLIEFLKSKDIVPEAYSPLGSTNAPLLTDETAVELANKYSLNTADILIGYLLKKDIVVLPKSITPSRISSNFVGALAALSNLDAADIDKLDGVAAGGKQKRLITPPWGVDMGFDNWPLAPNTPSICI